jgi:hypothetical protein
MGGAVDGRFILSLPSTSRGETGHLMARDGYPAFHSLSQVVERSVAWGLAAEMWLTQRRDSAAS